MSARQRSLTIVLIMIGMLLIAFFGQRAADAYRRIQAERSMPEKSMAALEAKVTDVDLVRDWMTIPYIAKTYEVPAELLFEALEIPARGNREKSLAELNLQYFPASGGFVLKTIKAAILAYQPPLQPTTP